MKRAQIILLCVPVFFPCAPAQNITIDTTHPAKSFSPMRALGAGIDRLKTGSTDHVLTDPIIKQVLAAGWQPVTYRQNTELQVEAWHWNPRGHLEQSRQAGRIFHRQRRAGGADSALLGIPAAPPRLRPW